MKIYGIKSCSTVSKAIKFMKEHNIEFEFIDFKKESVDEAKIKYWLEKVNIKLLFNTRGTKYRTLKLKELDLDDNAKIEWMAKENYLLKRPIVEYGDSQVIVAFNEDIYRELFS